MFCDSGHQKRTHTLSALRDRPVSVEICHSAVVSSAEARETAVIVVEESALKNPFSVNGLISQPVPKVIILSREKTTAKLESDL